MTGIDELRVRLANMEAERDALDNLRSARDELRVTGDPSAKSRAQDAARATRDLRLASRTRVAAGG
jgi:hypothetical protein